MTEDEGAEMSVVLPNAVLLLLRNSWGEIEWVLPVLYRLKKLNPSARIYTIFSCDSFYDDKVSFPTLFKLLDEVSECLHRPLDVIGVDTTWAWPVFADNQLIMERENDLPDGVTGVIKRWNDVVISLASSRESGELSEEAFQKRIQKIRSMAQGFRAGVISKREERSLEIENEYFSSLFDGTLKDIKFDVIFRDAGFDFRFHNMVLDRFPDLPVVRGEHGFDLTNRSRNDVDKEFVEIAKQSRHRVGRGDLWLTCCENLSDHLRTYWDEHRCCEVGFPRLDRWWIEEVLSASKNEIADMNLPQGCQRILWISRQIDDLCFDKETWKKIVRGTLEVIATRPDVHLIVKPHPRQDKVLLLKELDALPSERWTLWKGSTLSAASQADIVISVWSSAILDALAAGKPVVEYFEYPKEQINQAMGSDGRITGGWRESGIAVPADTPKEVHELLDLWKRDPNDAIWREQRRAYESLHPEGEDHSERTVREIGRLLGRMAPIDNSIKHTDREVG